MIDQNPSGIAWWTTDIGGYGGGKPSDPVFRELIVRWFQFGLTCPLFRQHGSRPTEIWLLGNESEAAVAKVIALRQHLQPYIHEQMERVSKTGQPINRPLFWDFPEDPHCWAIDDSCVPIAPAAIVSALPLHCAASILPCHVQPFLLLRCAWDVLH